MPIRNTTFAPNEYYHLYNRGNEKQKLLFDKKDWSRFLLLLLYFQSPTVIHNLPRLVNNFLKTETFRVSNTTKQKIITNRNVKLLAFTLMPNHFHLIAQEIQEGGISCYMHRVLTAYAKYFNEKYKHSGHVFQGPFQATHITSNRQLLHTSAYIHRNPRELSSWKNKEHQYPWSSYQDFVGKNRWENLLENQDILGQFKETESYQHFVETSGAKEKTNPMFN